MELAACRGVAGPDGWPFFGPVGEVRRQRAKRLALVYEAWCSDCPVTLNCRTYAEVGEEWGSWGLRPDVPGEVDDERSRTVRGCGPSGIEVDRAISEVAGRDAIRQRATVFEVRPGVLALFDLALVPVVVKQKQRSQRRVARVDARQSLPGLIEEGSAA